MKLQIVRDWSRRPRAAALLVVVSLLSSVALGPEAADAGNKDDEARMGDLVSAVRAQLSSSAEHAMHITTDKPLYHPGETVWFRAWEVTGALTPVKEEHAVTFTLVDPSGAPLMEKRVLYKDDVATNDFALPPVIAGGTFTVKGVSDRGATHEVKITVSAYELPLVKKSLEWSRASYGPGDFVVAEVDLHGATGEPLATKLTAIVSIGEDKLGEMIRFSNKKGHAALGFQLPAKLATDDVRMTILVDAGGVTESLERRVPVTLGDLSVGLFPEGGDLVVGLPSRVYVAGRDRHGDPAEVEGIVVDDEGRAVGRFKSLHDGMARFELTPQADHSYSVQLVKPRGAKVVAKLPAAKPEGCTLAAVDDFTSKRPTLGVALHCTSPQKVLATAVQRGGLVAHELVDVAAKRKTTIELEIPKATQGPVRVTLFDMDKLPLAERLVYRGFGAGAKVQVTADRDSYAPRDKVTLTVSTTDASGEPVPADVALSVVDDTVLSFADDDSAHLVAHLLLGNDLRGQSVHKANWYFEGDPKAPEAVDLLMGTAGYRRFEWRWVGKK